MAEPFAEIYEDRLFPSVMKSRSRLAALWKRHGQQFASRTGLWVENIKWNLTVSPFYVFNRASVITSLSEYISVCYLKPLEWAAVFKVCDLYHTFGSLGRGTRRTWCSAPKRF